MNAELLFIYDSHCPWSYAATKLINEIAEQYPEMKIHFWHNAVFSSAEYGHDNTLDKQQINAVSDTSNVIFSAEYQAKFFPNEKNTNQAPNTIDSTLAANLLAWTNHKATHKTLDLLNALQKAHFQEGNALTTIEDVQYIIDELKLSPPAKVLTSAKLAKEVEFDLHEIFEIQEIIETKAIPALLLAHDENLTLLNHHYYLSEPDAIVEAIALELKNSK
jgi:protein-disulfide isomerase-like protein with CxxC motif